MCKSRYYNWRSEWKEAMPSALFDSNKPSIKKWGYWNLPGTYTWKWNPLALGLMPDLSFPHQHHARIQRRKKHTISEKKQRPNIKNLLDFVQKNIQPIWGLINNSKAPRSQPISYISLIVLSQILIVSWFVLNRSFTKHSYFFMKDQFNWFPMSFAIYHPQVPFFAVQDFEKARVTWHLTCHQRSPHGPMVKWKNTLPHQQQKIGLP